jgi:acyl carrier protein
MNPLDQLFAEIFDDHDGPLPDDLLFVDVPGWQSLKHAELVVGIEQRFGVDLSRDDIAQLTSRGAAVQVLRARGHAV